MSAGSKGPDQISTTPDPAVSAFTNEVREQSKPARELFFKQLTEALSTGGVGARIPIAQASIEASKAATSKALLDLDERLGRTRLAGTPFGETVRASAAGEGERAAASIYPAIANQLLQVAPNIATGTAGIVIQGLTNAANIGVQQGQLGTQEKIATIAAQAQMVSALLGAVGKSGAAMGAG